MNLSTFLHKRLCDLLEDARIVVWYDVKGDFQEFAASFLAPNCEVLSPAESTLKARRRADEVYRLMNESEKPAEAGRRLLVYVPRARGASEQDKMADPFEVYALAGAAFGDTEDQRLESLARQAMPGRAEEITRLFGEGRPAIALLDGLERAQRYPQLLETFKTESPAEVIALAICDPSRAETTDRTPEWLNELLRLAESSIDFKPSGRLKAWKTIRAKLSEYTLFSEFVFDLPGEAPAAWSAVPRAGVEAKETIFAACDRMRSDDRLRETYSQLAQHVENELRLGDVAAEVGAAGERDTFPFEERQLLHHLVECAAAGDGASVGAILEGRKRSIWRNHPDRSLLWTTAERGATLLGTADRVAAGMSGPKTLAELVTAYATGGWSDLDRDQRLFEAGVAACGEDEEIAALAELCRRRYRELALQIQGRFLERVRAEGWPPEGAPRQTRVFDERIAPALERREKVAFFMVDSLRYEMGRDLGEALKRLGEVELGYAAAVFPTTTDCGMAALMPKADGMLRLVEKDGRLAPALGTRLLAGAADRMKLLKETYGDRFVDMTLDDLMSRPKKLNARLKDADLLVIRIQDPDAIGESLGGWRARRYLSHVIPDIASAVRMVVGAGFRRIVIAADHGHVMLPEIPPGDVVQGPSGLWIETKRRCRLGSGLSGGPGALTLKAAHVGIHGDVEEVCFPEGFKVFADGEGYFHGGFSLQETVTPVIVLQAGGPPSAPATKPKIDILYRSTRFTTRVIGLKLLCHGDMFTTPIRVLVQAYDGAKSDANVVGEAADCEARDEKTREVTLQPQKETSVPVLIDPHFQGPEIEIRVSDPGTRVVWATMKLKNAMVE